MSGNLRILGRPNPVSADLTTVTFAGGVVAAMPASNLKVPEPSTVGRIGSTDPLYTAVEVEFAVTTAVDAVMAFAHNLYPGDQWRVVGNSGGTPLPADPITEAVKPDTIVVAASTNVVGAVGDVDESIQAPDSAYLVPSDEDLPWTARLTFFTPAATPAAGLGYQCFVIRARVNGTGAVPDDHPTIGVDLYEGGALKANLGTKSVTDPNQGQLLFFPWDAAVLGTASGAAVEVRITGTPGSDLTSAQVNTVSWYTISDTDKAAVIADSGWQTVPGADAEAAWGGTALQETELPALALIYQFAVRQSLNRLRIEVRSDGVGLFTSFQATPARTPDGFVEFGYLVAGPAFEHPYNFAPGGELRVEAKLIGEEATIGGQSWAVELWRRRVASIRLPAQGETTAHGLFQRLSFNPTAPFAVILEPSATGAALRNGTFLATIADDEGISYDAGGWEDDPANPTALEPARSQGFTFAEKL